ncbi:MAG: fibronectin type III domain-containing protein [Lachnospiraceae bacterium]|nr:fibronectin type III domain-containing protein [Lachnospiraceae bacterium]
MKFKNKLLTALVTICMMMFILPMAVSAADAKDATGADQNTITCYVRAEQDDGTVLPYTKVTMNKNEVPSFSSYAIQSAPDDVEYITPMHILLQAMTDKGMTEELGTVNIASSGWITDMFGWGMDQLWCLNGIDAPVVSAKYEAKEGDHYTFYQAAGNWGAGFGYTAYGFFGEYGPGSDYTPYSAIETDDVTTEVGQDVELTYRYTSSMHTPQYGPCNNEDGAYTMIFVGKDGEDAVTDEDYREDIEVDKDGKFKVSFDKPGTYVVSGRYYNNDNTRGACNAYCKVTVKTPEAVTAVIEKIDAIGEVTLESEGAIKEARTAYDALTDTQKALVTNKDVLEKAENTWKELKDAKDKADAADAAAAKEVTEKIDAIGEVTLESEGAIKEARTAYDALTDTQKALVTNKDVLEKAENTWKELKDAKDKADAADAAAAKEVTEKIDAIGEVTLESEGAIKEARTAYDALTDTQKALVTNKDVLEKAENTWKELKDAKDKNDAIEAATPKTIDLSKTRFTYNGKTQKPKVTVKNAKGKVIPASNYTVKYSGKCKNVGAYKMTLTFKGDYKGTKTKTFVIEPKTTSIRSLKAGKKSFAVKWVKKTTQVSGYKVEYSTDKNFKKSVNSKVVLKNNSVSRTMKNLKAKKTYYVRVRTYKTVKYNGKSMHLHSKWSIVKKVTVK